MSVMCSREARVRVNVSYGSPMRLEGGLMSVMFSPWILLPVCLMSVMCGMVGPEPGGGRVSD